MQEAAPGSLRCEKLFADTSRTPRSPCGGSRGYARHRPDPRARRICGSHRPSGSGKNTLLNIIGLLDRPTKGRLFVEDQETGTLNDAAITRLRCHSIGFVFQYHYLISAFTALFTVPKMNSHDCA
jgi:hypothetical protein